MTQSEVKCNKRNDVDQDYTTTLCNKNNEVNKIDEIGVKIRGLWGQGKPWQGRGEPGWTKNGPSAWEGVKNLIQSNFIMTDKITSFMTSKKEVFL